MKGCLLVLGFLAAGLAAVAAFVWFGTRDRDPDQEAHLTQRVSAEVVAHEREADTRSTPNNGYRVQVRYQVDDRWWATEGWVPALSWTPTSGSVWVCVDPDDPAAVAIPSIASRVVECGEGHLGRNGEQRAEPSTAP